jgi:hypothetical protein
MNSVEYGNETDSEVCSVSFIVPSPINATFKINGKRDNVYIYSVRMCLLFGEHLASMETEAHSSG